jgi:GT2 family glycosyltransferase
MAVVVTHNGADWIEDCLQSLANSHHPVRVVVVDNGSTDNTLALVDTFPGVICLPQHTNLGFGRGNNIALRVALDQRAGWVFLLNQDARVEPEAIGELVRVSVAHPRFGILSPFHLDKDGANLDARFSHNLYRVGSQLLSDLYLGRKQEVYSTTFVNAAAWLLTSECLDTVGGFDPLFFMYGEDNDYCNRVTWHGLEIGVVPSAIVFHDRAREWSPHEGQEADLKTLKAWRFSDMLQDLQRPHGTFVRRVGSWGMTNLRTGLALIGVPNPAALLAWAMALLGVIACLPRIWTHRRVNRQKGRHWI